MARSEIETVLADWIEQAFSRPGQLPPGVAPAEWWRIRAEGALDDAEIAAKAIRDELSRLGGRESFGEALHELSHLQDALAELRTILELTGD